MSNRGFDCMAAGSVSNLDERPLRVTSCTVSAEKNERASFATGNQ